MSSPEMPPSPEPTQFPDFLTAAEVGKILRLQPYTVTQLCKEGKIRATKVFGQWRITKADLDAAIAKGYEAQQGAA